VLSEHSRHTLYRPVDLATALAADFAGVAAAIFSFAGEAFEGEAFAAREGLALALSVSFASATAEVRALAGFSFATFEGVGVAELLLETRCEDESLALFEVCTWRIQERVWKQSGEENENVCRHCFPVHAVNRWSIGVNASGVAEKLTRSLLRAVRWDTWLSAQVTWRCKPGSIEV